MCRTDDAHDPLNQIFRNDTSVAYTPPVKKNAQELANIKKNLLIEVEYETWIEDFLGRRYNVKAAAVKKVIQKVSYSPSLVEEDKNSMIAFLNSVLEPRIGWWQFIVKIFSSK